MQNGDKREVLFSGIQPSGVLTLGNLLGALKHWRDFQRQYHCFFSIVDLHAITVRQDPKHYSAACYDLLALFLASGIDTETSHIFLQSKVPAHTQLSWLLTCHTYMGELQRMTQFKDKMQKHQDNINAGLFNYPVLMAADILLYQAKLVPVGADQKQHMELTRNIAIRFNNCYGEVFVIPEAYIPATGDRIMSLQNPLAKMSKSDSNTDGTILFTDTPEMISGKIKRAVTDSERSVRCDAQNKPVVSNLLTILSAVSGQSIEYWERECSSMNYGQFKSVVAEQVVAFMRPLQELFAGLRGNITYLNEVLRQGAEVAGQCAQITLRKAQAAMGFIID